LCGSASIQPQYAVLYESEAVLCGLLYCAWIAGTPTKGSPGIRRELDVEAAALTKMSALAADEQRVNVVLDFEQPLDPIQTTLRSMKP